MKVATDLRLATEAELRRRGLVAECCSHEHWLRSSAAFLSELS